MKDKGISQNSYKLLQVSLASSGVNVWLLVSLGVALKSKGYYFVACTLGNIMVW